MLLKPPWTYLLGKLDAWIERYVSTDSAIGFDDLPDDCKDVRAALLGTYAGQFAAYTTLLWQVPALSLTAQAFLFTIALDTTKTTSARVATAVLSLLTSAMSIYLMISHRIHAARHGRVAADLAIQLGGKESPDRRNAVGVWGAVNEGSFAFWMGGLALFGLVGLIATIVALLGG